MADTITTDATLPDITAKAADEAKLDGIKQAIADNAAQQFRNTDGVAVGDPDPGITPTYDVFHLQDVVDMDPDALKKMLTGKDDSGTSLSEGQIAGLLEVKRSGKNRTDVVKVFCDVLKIKTPYEVTDAGPAYTNDVNRSVVKPRG